MQSLGNMYHDLQGGNCPEPNNYNFLQQVLMSSVEVFNIQNTNVSTVSMAEAKAAAANKSHSEAERRRRKRINGHLATLRSLLPNTIKSDKASLLAEVVRCIRELKNTTAELLDGNGKGDEFISNVLPGEADELKLSYIQGSGEEESCGGGCGSSTIKATICCEDRPEIMMEMNRALNSVQAKVVKAEMSTVGGRTKTVLWVEVSGGGGGEGLLTTLKRALKGVVDKSILLCAGPGQTLPVGGGNKRPRLYHC